jgi:hypothetical protein
MKVSEGHTSPPDYLTESELIALMEKNGIGKLAGWLGVDLVAGQTKMILYIVAKALMRQYPCMSTTSAKETM